MTAPAAPSPEERARLRTREFHREKIRQTVERIAPAEEIDTTKVLSEEDQRKLADQTVKHMQDKKLAEQEGRKGLIERLKRAAEKTGSGVFRPPEKPAAK